MRIKSLGRLLVLLAALTFVLGPALSMAAEKPWFVIKDVKGHCKVIQAKDKTPKTVAGPFPDKETATKAKAEKCPKTEKKEPAKKEPAKTEPPKTEPAKKP